VFKNVVVTDVTTRKNAGVTLLMMTAAFYAATS
jgi:hypothetical protein